MDEAKIWQIPERKYVDVGQEAVGNGRRKEIKDAFSEKAKRPEQVTAKARDFCIYRLNRPTRWTDSDPMNQKISVCTNCNKMRTQSRLSTVTLYRNSLYNISCGLSA